MKLPNFIVNFMLNKANSIFDKQPEPDIKIGGQENPYMLRWYMIPRNRFLNLYLHKFLRDDDDRALHDHPWASLSLCVSGDMNEVRKDNKDRKVGTGELVYRGAEYAHRLEIVGDETPITFFATGPRIRQWGFWCSKDSPAGGWRHHKEFSSPLDQGSVGRGCD